MSIGVIGALAIALGLLAGPATADGNLAAAPTAIIRGFRVVITAPGKQPKSAWLVIKSGSLDGSLRLKRKGTVWRSEIWITEDLVPDLVGSKVKIRVKLGRKTKILRTTLQAPDYVPLPGCESVNGNPVFPAPGVDQSGKEAWASMQGCFEETYFTNCATGGGCDNEVRYVHFRGGRVENCGATPAQGAPSNQPENTNNMFLFQRADGAYIVQYDLYSAGQIHTYQWWVTTDRSVTGFYWLNANPTTMLDPQVVAPTTTITGLL